jgi:hypothetical protein
MHRIVAEVKADKYVSATTRTLRAAAIPFASDPVRKVKVRRAFVQVR